MSIRVHLWLQNLMGFRTPLYDNHIKLGAKMVDFGGWDMPLHYGSQIEEHHQVRTDCGMFDVSHMNVLDLRGAGVRAFFRLLLPTPLPPRATPPRAPFPSPS